MNRLDNVYQQGNAAQSDLPASDHWLPPQATKLFSGRQASGGDELWASSARRRRSPRVTDSPAFCWKAPFSPTDSDTQPFFFEGKLADFDFAATIQDSAASGRD